MFRAVRRDKLHETVMQLSTGMSRRGGEVSNAWTIPSEGEDFREEGRHILTLLSNSGGPGPAPAQHT